MEVKLLLDTSAYSGFRRGDPSVVEKISGSDSVLISPVMLAYLIIVLSPVDGLEFSFCKP